MKKDVYMTRSDIPTAHGIIPAGTLVCCSAAEERTTVSTLDKKFSCSITNKTAAGALTKCKLTCGDSYVLFMVLNTSYHTYTAIGRDPAEMYGKIVQMYNYNAGTKYSISNFADSEDMKSEHVRTYRIKNDLIWFDDEYHALPEEKGYIGDYFSLYRGHEVMYREKDWFSRNML